MADILIALGALSLVALTMAAKIISKKKTKKCPGSCQDGCGGCPYKR